MADSLRAKTINALSWSFVESVVRRGIQFIVSIILARLLFPEQFGLIGMLLVFMAVARIFVESGFGAALIQKRETTATDICSIFYFNVLVGLLSAGSLCLAAPWIAAFYKQPVLSPLMRVLSLTIIIDSFRIIQETLFKKEINFKVLTERSLVAGLLSGAVGIGFAVAGFGVWSLVAQQVSASFFRTISLWVISPWRPALIFSFAALRKMFGFGSRILFSGLLNQIFDNIYYLVIGKLFSAADLGLFTRARTMQDLPSQTLSDVVGRVTFPVFSKSQDDPARLKKRLARALTVLGLLNFPMMVGLAVTARPLVVALLGVKWAGCIPYFQLLCVLGLLYPLQAINMNLILSVGRSDLLMRLQIIKQVLIVLNIVITWRWGISAMICGMIAQSVISYYLNSYYTRILVGYPLGEQLKDLFPYLAAAALMGMAAFSVGLLRFPNHFVMLFVQALVGVIVYVGLCWGFRLAAFVEIRREVCDRIPFLRADATG
jgi:teichuronic acid exporter